MAKRKLTPAQELREQVNRLAERYAHWEKERRFVSVFNTPTWNKLKLEQALAKPKKLFVR